MGLNAMMVNIGPSTMVLVEDTNQDHIHPECTRLDLRVGLTVMELVALTVL